MGAHLGDASIEQHHDGVSPADGIVAVQSKSKALLDLPEVREWKRARKEEREQHNMRQEKLVF